MKFGFKILALFSIASVIISLSSCSPVDKFYGVESSEPAKLKTEVSSDYSYPKIMSSDTVMPNYIDISLYDEENYAQVYLGKKFKFDISYAGTKLDLPSTYSKMTGDGWSFVENSSYDTDSTILPGETIKTEFENQNGIVITCVFYNSSNSTVKLNKCNIVKYIIQDNNLYNTNSKYGDFDVNGITNHMAITDIIDFLGSPSHFYAVSDTEYYLDYFISKDDRRNGITTYIDPTDDSITSIEFSYYK